MFRVPDEILAEIFSFCSLFCADAPLILGTVCTTFYNVVRNSPSVWSRLHLSIRPEKERLAVRKMLLWFKMSGACPVDLYLDLLSSSEVPRLPVDDGPSAFKQSHPMLIALFQHYRERINTLDIRSRTGGEATSFLDAVYPSDASRLAFAASFLHTLKIQCATDQQNSTSAQSPVFGSLSQLNALEFTNFFIPLPSASPSTPEHLFTGLRTIKILRPLRSPPLPPMQILHVLESAPFLREVEIETRITAPRPGQTHMFYEATLPRLQSLSLRTNNMSLLLGPLILPSLRELHMNDLNGRGERSAQKLSGALRRVLGSVDPSLGGLEVLELFGADLKIDETTDWGQCIRQLNQLQQLFLISMDGDALFAALTRNQEAAVQSYSGLLMGQLRHIGLFGSGTSTSLKKFRASRPEVKVDVRNQNSDGSYDGIVDVEMQKLWAGVWQGSRFAASRKAKADLSALGKTTTTVMLDTWERPS